MRKTFQISLASNPSTINEDTGEINGVSLITEGEVIGHDCFADSKTNQTVLDCCNKIEKVKVKLNHSSDASTVVGVLKNFRIEGLQVKADLHLLKNSTHYNYILELAKELAGHFGLSLAFKPTFEKINKRDFVRCSAIYSADIVDSPAANPNGLFTIMETNNETLEEKPELEKLDVAAPEGDSIKSEDVSALACAGCKETAKVLDNLNELHNTATVMIANHKDMIGKHDEELAAVRAELNEAKEALTDSQKLIDDQKKEVELLTAVVDSFNDKIEDYKKLIDATVKTFEVNRDEFTAKLDAQKVEFEKQLKSADILASRKLAATGVPMNLIPSADVSLSVVSTIEQLESITDPIERAAFFKEHKSEIYKAHQADINKKLQIHNSQNQ